MQRTIQIKLLPAESFDVDHIRIQAAAGLDIESKRISGYNILKKSIDARGKQARIVFTLQAFIDEPYMHREKPAFHFKDVSRAEKKVVIIGAGPAGLFAALKLIEAGIRPVLLERGKDIRARRRDLALLNKEGEINPESNYCFGEGGAGTYSDGKLYTRSTKRGDLNRILHLFTHFGAEENILFDAHPHIGTNKLPVIISAMRQQILDSGGLFQFEKKVIDFVVEDGAVSAVKTADGDHFTAHAFILATGHSARDIFQLLHDKKIILEPKPFALGVRVEHPQALIDSIQYHYREQNETKRSPHLPPASYSLVEQVGNKGVFSFCMCPGGIIAPAATANGELVVNGWSPSKRNNPFANSGIVISIGEKDLQSFKGRGPLAGMYFQQSVEQKAFHNGGGKFVAPAQRMADFVDDRISANLPPCSYLPGIRSAPMKEVFPGFITDSLRRAFKAYGKKMKGYYTNEAVLVATESRTSSPVRIPRNQHLQHPQLKNLYPCGEGAGFAGGIVSAAMDGERVALQITAILTP